VGTPPQSPVPDDAAPDQPAPEIEKVTVDVSGVERNVPYHDEATFGADRHDGLRRPGP
jgi:hypothetical protein